MSDPASAAPPEVSDEACTPFLTLWREGLVIRVVDGDTVDLTIDLGFEVYRRVRVRLLNAALKGINAPETNRTAERVAGLAAKARLMALLPAGKLVRLRSIKAAGSTEKFGRWLAVVLVAGTAGWRSAGDVLVAEGLAVEKDYE